MKIKKIFLSFVLMISMLCVVACKDKEADPTDPATTKADPTISVSVEDRIYILGEKLEDIDIIVAMGGTNGSIAWKNSSYVLVEGINLCEWVFTPTDTEAYNSKSGTLSITALKLETPEVVANIKSGQTVYIDAKYATIELEAEAKFGGASVQGEIVWSKPNETFKAGENICEWKFIPTQNTSYKTVTGTLTLTAETEQEAVAVSVNANTKTNYVAFDEIDLDSLTLCLIYNGGKVEEIANIKQECIVTYNNGDSLRRGDTSATIIYNEFSTQVENLVVDYRSVDNPVFNETVVYSGSEKILSLATDVNSNLYTFEPLKQTDAGEYDLVVTLKDSENYKWENGDLVSTIVKCTIQKADFDAVEEDYNGEYDGLAHVASVSNQTENDIYYSLTELNESNYSSASLEPIEKTNAGIYTIYYYMEGDSNYNDKAGRLTINISKQTPNISLEYCYTLKTGNVVNYPTEYISIMDKQDNVVEKNNLQFTYYTTFSDDANSTNDVKTTASDGALTTGGAPKNDKTTEYYVVVEYLGGENYNAVKGFTILYIDGADLEFYAKSSEDGFAFKDEIYSVSETVNSSTVTITGSNSECNAYLEFKELDTNSNGLKIVEFSSKFGEGIDGIKSGRLVYANGKYQLFSSDGKYYGFSYNGSSKEITIEEGVISETVLKKWEFPKYLKTFYAQTVSDGDYNEEKNTSKNTEITFYNDYGTIRFSAKVNVLYSNYESLGFEEGGYVEWAGVAEVEIARDDTQQLCYFLNCYLINNGTLESTGYSKTYQGFQMKWNVTLDGNSEPTNLLLNAMIGSLLSEPYDVLLNLAYKDVSLSN